MDPASVMNSTALTGISGAAEFLVDYAQLLPSQAMKGDVAALVFLMIGVYVGLIVVNKLTDYLVKIVKNLMILTIIGAAFYTVARAFMNYMQAGEAEPTVVIAGLIGLALGFIGVVIAFYFLVLHTKKSVRKARKKEGKAVVSPAPGPQKPFAMKELLSLRGIKKGQHTLTTMITYILIAEFGVFSSVTISAPSVEVGIGLLVAFVIGVSLYVFKTYPNPVESLKILFIAMIVGLILSVILGVVWDPELTWEIVLSPQYFTKPTLVAFLTGIALSLFMAGKEMQEQEE